MAIFEDNKSSNDIIINDTMSDDKIVVSDVPRGTCLKGECSSTMRRVYLNFHPFFVYFMMERSVPSPKIILPCDRFETQLDYRSIK